MSAVVTFKYAKSGTHDPNQITHELKSALDYLNYVKSGEKILADQLCYEAIFQLGYHVAFNTQLIHYNVLLDNHITQLLAEIFSHLYDINEQYDFTKSSIAHSSPNPSTTFNERCVSIFFYGQYLINLISNKSIDFIKELHNTSLIRTQLQFIDNDQFVEKNASVGHSVYSSVYLGLIDYLSINMSRFSVIGQNLKDSYSSWNALNILLKLRQKRPDLETYVTRCILNIANDKQIETLTEIHSCAQFNIALMKKCAESIQSNQVVRNKRLVITDNNISEEFVICIKDAKNLLTGAIVIFEGFYNLSVNDMLRSKIYFDADFKENFKVVLFNANLIEQKLCLRVLSQLTFNESIALDVKSDAELVSYINTNLVETADENIRKYCNQINWNIEQEKCEQVVEVEPAAEGSNDVEKEEESDEKHVMISYNSSTRDMCLKIKEKLEKAGHRVWIDVSDIHGSSLDSMAKAVENSLCVLLCINEKYRLSIYCQAEAQYAFRLNKPIIPLIMQKDFEKVTGWLGIIIGDKIYVHFAKYPLDVCINKLFQELKNYLKSHVYKKEEGSVTFSAPPPHGSSDPVTNGKIEEVEKMSTTDVAKWFSEINVSQAISANLANCDGATLKQLYEIKQREPEFYNQSLRSFQNLNIFDIAKFSAALENLFK